CASCHSVHKEVVGPALKDIDKRRSEKWIIDFVHSSQKMIRSGDTAAVNLYKSHNEMVMPDHPDLNDQDIKNIIAYIQEESDKVIEQPSVALTVPKPYPGKSGVLHQLIYLDVPGNHMPITSRDYDVWMMIGSILVFIVLVLSIAVKVNDLEDKQ